MRPQAWADLCLPFAQSTIPFVLILQPPVARTHAASIFSVNRIQLIQAYELLLLLF